MILNLIVGASLALGFGYSDEEKVISEVHKIYEIDNQNFVHGELVNGSGEGIYYSVNQLNEEGIKDVKIGDEIKFIWTKQDFENKNWEEFDAERVD